MSRIPQGTTMEGGYRGVCEVQHMGTARYAFRVRGRESDAVLAALEEGLEVEIAPTRTAVQGWLADQAALSGMLARIRLLGLELLEVRRLPVSR